MKTLTAFLCLLVVAGCASSRTKRYQDMLEPKVGSGKKDEINKMLGSPSWCRSESGSEKCEYRTSKGSHAPVPDMYRKEGALGPDLSPYDQFDVLHLYYDGVGVLKDWEPVVVRP